VAAPRDGDSGEEYAEPMLRRLHLHNFKNFEDAELSMGPFTLLVGANAAGKSNLREALRFLHGLARGYTLAEVFDEKWSAGERQWEGIRGGRREVGFRGAPAFRLSVELEPIAAGAAGPAPSEYAIEVFTGDLTQPPRIGQHLGITSLSVLRAMRFIDLDPQMMRRSSTPGQTTLTDRGENLSSVLHTLCSDASTKEELIRWLRLLTPMDVADLRFESDVRGQVILMIVEKDGHAYSAYSASDGTLRFLGMLAALFSPEPGLYFFEEIENGLHPTRVRLLVDLIEARARTGKVQIVATTHSPVVLADLHDDSLQHASLVYRLEGEPSSRITRLLDVPDAARVLATHDRADLLASGWFEDMVEFAATPSEPVGKAPGGGEAA
jgi:predicted ATPase